MTCHVPSLAIRPTVELKVPVEGRIGLLRPGCAHRVMVKAGLGVL